MLYLADILSLFGCLLSNLLCLTLSMDIHTLDDSVLETEQFLLLQCM